ncbi:Gmad2 immunoglobulin-like domain-containing protein [Candidatus Pacebacteria bacterium]|nr:Gmad2 immunoglobulin-like domain-containing protein [Candidatus Paceibacterota bacterium]
MKFITLIGSVMVLLLIVALVQFSGKQPEQDVVPIKYVTEPQRYECANDGWFTVEYDNSDTHARLSLSGMQYELERDSTANDAVYTDPSADILLRRTAEEVRMQFPGMTEAVPCQVATDEVVTPQWVTYQAPNSNPPAITFDYPSTATITVLESDVYEVRYDPQKNDTAAQITDGYQMFIRLVTGDSVDSYVSQTESASEIATTTIRGIAAYRYVLESEPGVGQFTHYVFAVPKTTDELVDISYRVATADAELRALYEGQVTNMIDSLVFGAEQIPDGAALIKVSTPTPKGTVTNPAVLTGEARGQWFFEASAPVVIVDWDGRIIGEGFVTADGNWMTEEFVPFTGSVQYELPADSYSTDGTVIFQRSNPSGLPENDAALEIPVTLTR